MRRPSGAHDLPSHSCGRFDSPPTLLVRPPSGSGTVRHSVKTPVLSRGRWLQSRFGDVVVAFLCREDVGFDMWF